MTTSQEQMFDYGYSNDTAPGPSIIGFDSSQKARLTALRFAKRKLHANPGLYPNPGATSLSFAIWRNCGNGWEVVGYLTVHPFSVRYHVA
jgi:hypothetical protein